MDIHSFLLGELGRMQPPNMAHLPPMPELKRIRRPLLKRTSKAKREATQPVQSACPTGEPAFVGAVSAASREVPDAPLLPVLKDQPVSIGSSPEVPAVQRISDSQAPSPQGRFLQAATRHERLQQSTVPTQVLHYPAPSSQKGFQQPPVAPKGSEYPYEGLGSKMLDYPAMLRLQHMSVTSMTSNIQAPTPCGKSTQPPMPPRVSNWSQQPLEQQRVSRPQAPVPPMVSNLKSPVLPVAPNVQAPPSCEKYQQLPGLQRVPDTFVPSELSQCPRKVSDQTQSSHVWSQQTRDSSLQIPVSSNIPSPQEPFPSVISQQVSASWVSNPHAPSPWKTLHQSSVSRVTHPQVAALASVSNPQNLSPCEGFQQPPVLSNEWSQQLSTGHQHPQFQCIAEELQKLPDAQVLPSHGSSQYTQMISKIPLESKAPIAYNSRKTNFTAQSRAQFDNASKQKQPNMHQALTQNTLLKQQYFQSHYAMQQAYQQYQQSNHQKLNYQPPNQPVLNNIYGYRQQDSNLQSFPQLPSGYQRNGTVPCSMPQCRTYQEQMTQQYRQRKHTPTEVQPFLQQCQSSQCQPWPNQYNCYQQNLNMHNYQQQIQNKMQNKLHTPPGKIECIQQEHQNANPTKLNYDHRMNERTQPFLEKPVQHYMRNPAEQIQYPALQKKPTREQHEISKPLMQTDSNTYQQLCDQRLLHSGWQMNPLFQQREDAQQNIKAVKEADAMLIFQTKYRQKPDYCTDNPTNLVYHTSHESVEIYSQVSKIEVAKYSISKAETKEQISAQITNSPAFAQTGAMNVACQLSPPATPIDLRKFKENKPVECPCPVSSIKADPDKVDQSFCQMSYAKPDIRSPISNTETCNEYTSSNQNNTGLVDQAVTAYNLAPEHQSAILSPNGFSVPLHPSGNPTIFSPTPPPTPPDEQFPEWNKTAMCNQRKSEGNDVQESTISSTPSAEDVAEKHSIERPTLPETEISNQSVECPPRQPIYVASQQVNREQAKIPEIRIENSTLPDTEISHQSVEYPPSQPIYVATQQTSREQAKIPEIRIESSTLPETEISHQSVECPPTDNIQPIHLASQQVNREQAKIPKIRISLNPCGTHFISNEPSPLEDASQSALMSSEEHFADSSSSSVQPKEKEMITEREQRRNKRGRKCKLQINTPLPEKQLGSNQQESPLPEEPLTSGTETSTGVCDIQSLSSTQNETSHYVPEPSCTKDNSCSSVQPKDIVGTVREKKNKKEARKLKPQVNMHPDKQLINQQESPSTSLTETSAGDGGIQNLSSMQNERFHYVTAPSCIMNNSSDSQKVPSDNRTTQQAMSEEENVMTDNKMLIDKKNQTQVIATPPIENSHGFAKEKSSSVDPEIRDTLSKCSVITDKQKPNTVSKHVTSSVKMYDCLGSVHFISRCYRTMCFVCNKEVGGKNVINHLFFPHLKCKDCKTIIKSCQAYSLLKRSLRKGKTRTCCSVSGHHNFDRWNVSPVDFLTYKIRKFIVFRDDRGYNNQPTEKEVIDEMEKYTKKLLMLQFLKPWKFAIKSCNKYIKTIKQTNSESIKQAKKRERVEDPEKENGKVKKARKNNNKNVRKPILKTLSQTGNTISSSRASCSQIAESSSFDKTTNRSEGTIATQEQGKKGATKERTVHKVPSIVTKIIQEPSQAKRSGEPQPMEMESSLDAPLLELSDDFLLDSCNMDLLDQMTTYVSISDGP